MTSSVLVWSILHTYSSSYLFFLSALEVPPFLGHMTEIHFIHGHLHVSDGIVLGEAIEVVYRHHQSFASQLSVWNLYNIRGNVNQMSTYWDE